ncbi:hypothetical protein M4I32_09420 [Microbacterium sp. LRZ72]|uniref:hypothetical protein n=1 Tax=Microbacterium sp. LRZ72 TaxID=2942481 RepID=UPI0029B5F8B7|nr:hypothetical protein [Microbacterium sp. LRZ72]MDX2377016.1 hypothetical protein [Microbacterium sp. LRZ72]
MHLKSRTVGRRPPAFGVGPLTIPGQRASTWWWFIAATAIVANLVLTAYVGWTTTKPSFAFDEIHLLELSRLIAGFDIPRVRGAGYYPGWSALMAPLWWFSNDPEVVYRWSLVLGWVVGALTIYPLARLAVRFRISFAQGLAVAAVVMSLPARTVQADYSMSERLLFLLVAFAGLAAFRLWERPTPARAATLGLLVAATYFTHLRMLPLAIASGIWLLALALKRWQTAVTGLAVLALGMALAQFLGDQLNYSALGATTSQSESVMSKIENLRPGVFFRAALGQTWLQFVGSFGLVAIGFVAVVMLMWRELRKLRMGRATWVFGVFAATWLLSVVAWSSDWSLYLNPWRRLDAWVYGRYLDPIAGLVALIGLALLVRGLRAWVWVASTTIFVCVAIPVVLWVAREAPTWGYVTPAHIAGLLPWGWLLPKSEFPPGLLPSFTNENAVWLVASLSVVVVLVALLLLRRWPIAVTLGLCSLAIAGSLGANASSDKFRASTEMPDEAVNAVQDLVDQYGPFTVAWDTACGRSGFTSGVGQNQLGYSFVDEFILGSVRSDEVAQPDYDIVLGCVGASPLSEVGARPLADFEIYESWAWVLPGDLQEELAAQGELRPADETASDR